MKFFIDTANVEEIRKANDMGIIAGVTTNPSLIAKEGRDYAETLAEIATIVDGPISGEVKATTADADHFSTVASRASSSSPSWPGRQIYTRRCAPSSTRAAASTRSEMPVASGAVFTKITAEPSGAPLRVMVPRASPRAVLSTLT